MEYCLPCFGKSKSSDGEREPLLAKGRRGGGPQNSAPSSIPERSTVDKLVDALAALNAGKLPTQKQFSYFLQLISTSELLKEDRSKAIPGNGPTSKQGRKVLGDVRGLVQVLLEFGLEKNNDDKLQELYFQLKQTDSVGVAESALRAGQTAIDATKQGTSNDNIVDQQSSIQDQLAFDASTLLHAIRTLLETSMSSPVFRIAIYDLFSIVKDIVAQAAVDVGQAALQIQQAAEDVEQQVHNNDIIGRDAESVPRLDDSVRELGNVGKEAADITVNAVKDAKEELTGIGEELSDVTKEKLLERAQQVLSRVQKDPASRSAMRAIVLLGRKYSEKLVEISAIAEDAVIDMANQASDSLEKGKEVDPSDDPSQSCRQPQEKKPFLDSTALEDLKEMLQRIAKGHSLDDLFSAFGQVVRDMNEVPTTLEDEINKTIVDKMTQSATSSDFASLPPSPLLTQQPDATTLPKKGKSKKNKKARAREKRALEKQSSVTLMPSTSQEPLSPIQPESPAEEPVSNPLSTYFSRLGAYLDRGLEEPDWATSKEGSRMLESLFDDGSNLLNVVGESLIEVGEELIDENSPPSIKIESSRNSLKEDEIRRKFKKDLTSLLKEADAFIAAVQSDKTTMRLVGALDALGHDLYGLFFQGAKQGSKTLTQNISNLGGWSSWIGWAVPRILRMLPSSAIPIPSIEVKTGNIEGALHASFVQGLVKGDSDSAGASLVPDSVVLKEWTEMKIDMVDCQHSDSEAASSSSETETAVQMTSRVRIKADGVRARVEDMGYYFKYTGGIIGYEDEGVLSVDVGMGSPHEGFGAVVELEFESDNSPFDSGAEIPEIVVVDTSDELSTAPTAVLAPAEPLFRVVDVQVAMHNLKFRVDRSRHWILNKLFLQRLAGPVLAGLFRQALEEKLRSVLEITSKGLGAVIKDAKQKGEERRERARASSKTTDEEGQEQSLAGILSDWWKAVLEMGPMVAGRNAAAEHGQQEVDIHTTTAIDTTSKGIIYKTASTTVEQPKGTPAMVFDPATGTTETIDLPVEAIGGRPIEEQHEETIIAIGDGAQLFPGKGGPYGATGQSDERGVIEQVLDNVQEAVNGAADELRNGIDRAENVEERWAQHSEAEKRSKSKTWKSDAFDF